MTESWRSKMPERSELLVGGAISFDRHLGVVTRANAELDAKDARIAELEAKLAALTVRQPMIKAPTSGWIVAVDADGLVYVCTRVHRGTWYSTTGRHIPENHFLGWYALPDEVSR